jgi:hypothetical protein
MKRIMSVTLVAALLSIPLSATERFDPLQQPVAAKSDRHARSGSRGALSDVPVRSNCASNKELLVLRFSHV